MKVLIASLMVIALAGSALAADVNPRLGYNRDVRPILSDNCFACHGPDKNKRKGKFRLDERESALQKEAFIPGKADESELVKRIFSSDPKEMMPPPESNKKLSEAQKQILKTWIEQGAEYEPHWAYIVPKRPSVPSVKDGAWVRNPIDAFVLHTLEEKNLTHSAEADRRTLLRRLSLDLIGLPPTPAEVEAFVHDKSPDAYEKQVDRLLSSPHYGERMAVPWLDAVRFADTVGFHGDQNLNVFPYRDYVIDAFNHNKPFDQFTIEQIAGDLLPHPTTEQLIATAFNRLNMVTREGGAQPKEYLAKYMADRVRTIGSAFLGSTLNCCECHDHKYDPFLTRDFYSMGAFFADIKQWGVYMDYNYTPNKDLVGWSNDHPFPPEIVVDSPYLKQRQAKLLGQIVRVANRSFAKADIGEFDHWLKGTKEYLNRQSDGWSVLSPVDLKKSVATLTGDRSVLFGAPQVAMSLRRPGSDRVEFALEPGMLASVRLELLPHERHKGSIIRDGGAGATVQVAMLIKTASGAENKLGVYFADADFKDERYSNGYPIIGVKDAWKTSTEYSHTTQTAVYILNNPIEAKEGDRLVMYFNRNGAGCVRVSASPIAPLNPIDPAIAPLLAQGSQQDPGVRLTYLLSTDHDASVLEEIRQLHRQVLECRGGKSPVVVTVSVPPQVTRVLPRGNWQDESGAVVEPAVPNFLPHTSLPKDRRLNRLDLAHWLVATENPLTSRVFVNRLWKQFFGSGISNIVEDLGAQGESPSHPELLDWLAVEFRQNSWDVKHMVRLIATSSTYRQQSNLPMQLRESDPNDRLLAAQAPRRLEAEFVRDNALAISGLIDLDIGGPSVKPYQPPGYYANIQFPDRTYVPEADERQWRRGLYMHWQRTFLHPMLANFDAPSREDGICTRNLSNTPQQALTLLNDPEFVEASRVLAQKILQSHESSDEKRIDQIYQRTLCRSAQGDERQSLVHFLLTQRDYYKQNPGDAKKLVHIGFAPASKNTGESELAAWTSVCRVVLNLHETITRY